MRGDNRVNLDGLPDPTAPEPRGGRPATDGLSADPPAADPRPTRHLYDYLWILYKRRWLAVASFLLVVISSGFYAYTRIPIYRAHSRVVIQQLRNNYGFTEITAPENTPDYQLQVAILNSRSLVKKTMQALGLWQEVDSSTPAAPPPAAAAKPEPTKTQAAWQTVRGVMGVIAGGAAPTPQLPDASFAETRQIDGFASGLTISAATGGIVDIYYTSNDPEIAAKYANAVADQYVAQNLEFKKTANRDVSDWLSQRIIEQRAKVDAAEEALRTYREANVNVALDERGAVIVQGLSELTTSATKARTDRIEKEALYNQVRALQDDRAALESFGPLAAVPGVQQARNDLANARRVASQLSEKLLDKHPDLIRAREMVKTLEERLNGEITKAVEGFRIDFEKAKTTEASLQKTLEDQKSVALSTNPSGVELQVLIRDVEANRQVYQTMLDKSREAGLSEEIKSNNIRILDKAEIPRSPISPNTRATMQYGFMSGLAAAFGLVFLFEYLDNRIKSPDEVRSHLGIPLLGLVPTTKVGDNEKCPLLNNGVPMHFAEAFRRVRTNVLFSMPEADGRTVLVASAGPSEGKTLVASNLAIALAQAGQRVMIIDCDLRRPRVHEAFNVPQEPGLSNLIVGDAKASEMIRTAASGVAVLPAGRIPPNPAELLGSKRFQELLARLGERFDWIVIDSPPVMAVTDATVLAHLVSGVMFVASAEMTNKHAARTAVDQLVAADARVLGAVLNRVDLERNSYYYSHYYRREYARYYVK